MYSYKQYLTQQITKMLRTCIHTYKIITTILGKMTILSVKAQFREVEARGRILFLSSSSSWQNWADVTAIFSGGLMTIKHFVKLSSSFHSEIVFIMILSKAVLLLLSLGQDIIKCSSSSISREHNLQSRSSLVVLVFLPVSETRKSNSLKIKKKLQENDLEFYYKET